MKVNDTQTVTMALKETIGVWHDGATAFEDGDLAGALDTFLTISDPSARILFNIARVSKLNDSVKYLTDAITKDPHLAIAYYQRGLHYFTKKQYDRALQDFNSAEEKMHGRPVLDYSQLGMAFKLYSAEITITKAAVWQRKGNTDHAVEMVITASQEAEEDTVKKKCVSALQTLQGSSGGPLDPVKIHDHCIFHPPKSLTANLKKREYVAKAKVVSDYRSRENSPNPEGRQPANQAPNLPPRGGNQLDIPKKSRTLPETTNQGNTRRSNPINFDEQKKSATMAGPTPTRHLPPPPSRAAPILSMNAKDSRSAEDLSAEKKSNSLLVEKQRVRRHSHDVPREFDYELTKVVTGQLKKAHIGEPSNTSKTNHTSDRNGSVPPPRPPRPPPPGIVVESDSDSPPPPVPRRDYPKPR